MHEDVLGHCYRTQLQATEQAQPTENPALPQQQQDGVQQEELWG